MLILHSWGVSVIGQLYSVQYKGIFGALDKGQTYTCDKARPLSQVCGVEPNTSLRYEVVGPPHHHHIITTSSLYSYVGACIGQTEHVWIHVHLFGGPGKIHMQSSLIRISFNLSYFPFWLLNKATSLPSLSNLLSPASNTLLSRRAVSRRTERAQGSLWGAGVNGILDFKYTNDRGNKDLQCIHPLFLGILLRMCLFLLGLHHLFLCKASDHPLSKSESEASRACLRYIYIVISWRTSCLVILFLGNIPEMVPTSLSAALISASAGVIVGIVRYLCLINPFLTDSDASCIAHVYLMTLVVLTCVPYVVATGCVWHPCLSDPRVEICFNLAA
jgi:hypothetical protein